MTDEMNDSMSTMVLVGLSQSEWELAMKFIARAMAKVKYKKNKDEKEEMHIIIQTLSNQIY